MTSASPRQVSVADPPNARLQFTGNHRRHARPREGFPRVANRRWAVTTEGAARHPRGSRAGTAAQAAADRSEEACAWRELTQTAADALAAA